MAPPLTIISALSLLFTLVHGDSYNPLQTLPDRPTMVHLFEWKWTDIANECETFLAKYKYGAVQISPPNEHVVFTLKKDGREYMPWYIRYQPVSYKLNKSRSGTEAEFVDMVNRCNKVGVRIIVDSVINHMVAVGQKYPGQYGTYSSAGSPFDATDNIESFPGVPYSTFDFNDNPQTGRGPCHGDIGGDCYNTNAWCVRQCRLDGLLDLDHDKDYVKQQITNYFNKVIGMGVAGLRIDAAKHMWPDALIGMLKMVNNLNSTIYGPNQRPFVVQEVIDKGGEAIKAEEYLNSGRVTNFKYGIDVAAAVRGQQNFKYFNNFGPGWGYMNSESSLVFVDNHDNQRDDSNVLSYKNGAQYIMGVSYMLAWTYGYTRVMSSYYFDVREQGPPNDADWITRSPSFLSDETCNSQSGWVCEHRWPAIRRMVTFRSVVEGQAAADVVTEDHRIAFRRGSKGFYALNNAYDQWNRKFYVGMMEGSYCDVISGEYDENGKKCTGLQIDVDNKGEATISIPSKTVVAIHFGQKNPPTPFPPPDPLPSSYKRTAILVQKETAFGQDLFIRGGLDQDSHGCKGDTSAYSSRCSMPVVHRTNVSKDDFGTYVAWGQEDRFLDWFGAEEHQGTYHGITAQGTPLVWTTNQPGALGYHPLNTYGPNYWLVDTMMDCSKTDNGWFSFKAFLKKGVNEGGFWENDIAQSKTCQGDAQASTPSEIGQNHAGMCGQINVYTFGQNDCQIKHFA